MIAETTGAQHPLPRVRKRPFTGSGETRSSGDRFDVLFATLFGAHHAKVFRVLNRSTGDPELSADVTQEAFTKLYRRGSMPDSPEAWLITVAMNLMRSARSTQERRRRLLTPSRARAAYSDPPPSPSAASDASESRRKIRAALDQLAERERHLLLLRAEGYSYRDIAKTLRLKETSVGKLIARAKKALRESLEEGW